MTKVQWDDPLNQARAMMARCFSEALASELS